MPSNVSSEKKLFRLFDIFCSSMSQLGIPHMLDLFQITEVLYVSIHIKQLNHKLLRITTNTRPMMAWASFGQKDIKLFTQ